MIKHAVAILLSGFLFVFLSFPSIFAFDYDQIRIIKISAEDEQAVVKINNNAVQIVRPGDSFDQTAKITGISDDRIVVKEVTGNGVVTIILKKDKTGQHIERISSFSIAPASIPEAGKFHDSQKKIKEK